MYTVKDVARISRTSIRSLRYYDETGLLPPTAVSDAGYRLYNDQAVARLTEILLYRRMGMPLGDIRLALESPEGRRDALARHQQRLRQRLRHIRGMLRLMDELAPGEAPDFTPLTWEEAAAIADHGLKAQSAASIAALTEHFGSVEGYRAQFIRSLMDPATSAHLIRLHGSKDRLMSAVLREARNASDIRQSQDACAAIYRRFAQALSQGRDDWALEATAELAAHHKALFRLDSAQYLLTELAEGYLHDREGLAQITDRQYGPGVAAYIGRSIRRYYGLEEGSD